MISVLIPVHNRPEMLERAVDSVLAQSFRDYELVVIDDGSIADLSRVRSKVEAAGHRFLVCEHRGVAAARNRGIKESCGAWLALLDSDDYWHQDKLATQVEFHSRHPEFKLSQCEERWHRNGKRVNKKKYHAMASGYAFHESLERCCISASSIMLHRDVLRDVGVFDEQLAVCEDYDLWIRVSRKYEIGLIDRELVFKFGGHEDQLSQSQPAMDRFRVYAMLKLLEESDITAQQDDAIRKELNEKITVLLKGAQKHDPDAVPLYTELLQRVVADQNLASSRHELLCELKGSLPDAE